MLLSWPDTGQFSQSSDVNYQVSHLREFYHQVYQKIDPASSSRYLLYVQIIVVKFHHFFILTFKWKVGIAEIQC